MSKVYTVLFFNVNQWNVETEKNYILSKDLITLTYGYVLKTISFTYWKNTSTLNICLCLLKIDWLKKYILYYFSYQKNKVKNWAEIYK